MQDKLFSAPVDLVLCFVSPIEALQGLATNRPTLDLAFYPRLETLETLGSGVAD
jgi:hypothetical protein